MGLDAQVKELESSFDELVKLAASGSTFDKLRWITTPREAELATAVVNAMNQSLQQASQALQQLSKIGEQAKGQAG